MSQAQSPSDTVQTPATTTTINPRWRLKMWAIALVMAALGVWGLLDALHFYPRRGERAAAFGELQYLKEVQANGSLTNDGATIATPDDRLSALLRSRADGTISAAERPQLDWLTQLKLIGELRPENTSYPRVTAAGAQSADERLKALEAEFTSASGAVRNASPLSWWDIPSQYVITLAGFGVAAYLAWLVMRVSSRRYSFDHASQRLTLPDGASITPSDIREFDKSEWDKLFIKLHVRDGHPTLAGKTIRLDLLRYVPLEDWILQMERAAAPAEQPAQA